MKGIYPIFRKEMSLYFVSPIAYVATGVFLIIQQSFRAAMQAARFGGPVEIDVPGVVTREFFGVMATILLFIMPMLTMGVYAEERKRGTMELLVTSPVTDLELVLGKFLASLTLLLVMLLPTALQFAILFRSSDPAPPWRMVLAGYIGVLLLGSALIALGSFLSSLTENQIIASVTTFGLFLVLWVLDASVRNSSTKLGEVLQYLSVLRHYDDFTRGVVDTSNLIFYGSLIVLGIFLTLRSLDSMRWRRA